MIEAGHGSSVFRQTLIAIGAMVGGSGLFVTLVTVILSVAIDRAVDPGEASKTSVPGAGAASATAPAAAAPRPATTVGKGPGGRS